MSMLSGFFLLVKPKGIISMQITNSFKRLLEPYWGKIKIGHIGTLDPFATGLLPIAVGDATKLIPWVEKRLKSYNFVLKWGKKTTTGDLTGDVIAESSYRPCISQVKEILPQFHGTILQTPPRFSALKVNGKRAYDLARADIDFTLKARPQFIESLILLESTRESALLEVTCNTGTYIRTLGEDIAQALRTFGHLTHLTRSRVGSWGLKDGNHLDFFSKAMNDERALRNLLLSPGEILTDIPTLKVTEEEAIRLRKGLFIIRKDNLEQILACTAKGVLIALVRPRDGALYPFRVFNCNY